MNSSKSNVGIGLLNFEDNKDKIESLCVHVSLDLSLKAGFDLGLKRFLHFSAVPEWEKKVVKWAKKVVWIGIDKMPLHDKFDIIDIPNYYEFTQNKKVCMSNRVGFASRCETRKSPHFLDGVDSYVFTDTHDFNWWKNNLNLKFEKTRVYQFNYNNLHKFFDNLYIFSNIIFMVLFS